jgi:hypothetical protein
MKQFLIGKLATLVALVAAVISGRRGTKACRSHRTTTIPVHALKTRSRLLTQVVPRAASWT